MKKYIISLFTAIFLISCASTFGTANLGDKIKKLELGMTKSEVIDILGKTYDFIGAIQTPDGNMETLRFTSAISNDQYYVNLLNGELVEYYRERPAPNPPTNTVVVKETTK